MVECQESGETYSMWELFEAVQGKPGPIIFLIVMTILSFATLFIFLEAVYYIDKKITNSRRKVRILVVLGIYPFLSLCALLSLYMPRAHLITFLTGTVFFSFAIFQFLMLIIGFYGGKQQLLERLKDVFIPLSGPPLTCCCPCLPKLPMTHHNLRMIKRLVLQNTIIRPIALFLELVLWVDGIYVLGNLKFTTINFYIQLASIGSTLVALWGLIMIMRISSGPLRDYSVTPKFFLVQICLILVSVQSILLPILVVSGAIPCTHLFNSGDRASYIVDIMIVIEMFLFVVYGRFVYRTRKGNVGSLVDDINNSPDDNDDVEGGMPSTNSTAYLKEQEVMNGGLNKNNEAFVVEEKIDENENESKVDLTMSDVKFEIQDGHNYTISGNSNI